MTKGNKTPSRLPYLNPNSPPRANNLSASGTGSSARPIGRRAASFASGAKRCSRDGAAVTDYSDEAWAQLVGGVTSQHVVDSAGCSSDLARRSSNTRGSIGAISKPGSIGTTPPCGSKGRFKMSGLSRKCAVSAGKRSERPPRNKRPNSPPKNWISSRRSLLQQACPKSDERTNLSSRQDGQRKIRRYRGTTRERRLTKTTTRHHSQTKKSRPRNRKRSGQPLNVNVELLTG